MKKKWLHAKHLIAILIAMVLFLLPAFAFAEDTDVDANEADTIETGVVYDTGSLTPYIAYSNIDVSTTGKIVTSYLVETEDGYMRVQYMGAVQVIGWENAVIIEYYDKEFHMVSQKKVECELSRFGGFFEGEDAYYLVYGEENDEEDDEAEVIRVVKYNKNWERLDATNIYAKTSDAEKNTVIANITVPFYGGSLRMAECDGYLYIHTCNRAYTSIDGLRHQVALYIEIRESDMEVIKGTNSSKSRFGYASHSFDQFVLVDDDANLVTLDQCDGSPSRGFVLYKIETEAGSGITGNSIECLNVFPCQSTGSNDIMARPGGIEYSDSSYIVAGKSVTQDENCLDHTAWNVFITVTSRDDISSDGTTIKWITDFDTDGDISVTATKLVKISSDKFLLLWTLNSGEMQYVFLDGDGNLTSEVFTEEASLSECQPIVSDGSVIWYVTDEKNPYFYKIDGDGNLTMSYEQTDISDFNVYLRATPKSTFTTEFLYTGTEIEPDTCVYSPFYSILEQGTDYTVSYSNNLNTGTAFVTITGIGKYTGEVVKTFTIYKIGEEDNTDTGDTGDSDTTSSGDTLMVRRGTLMYFNYTLKGGNADFCIYAGEATDQVLVGDWDGDGIDTICLRRGNVCYFIDDITTMNVYLTVTYGRSGDEVLVGDWDGDGKDSLAMRRNGNYYYFCNDITNPDGDTWSATYGRTNDEVHVGDWENSGYDSLAVRRDGNYYYFSLSKVTDPDGDVWQTTFGRSGDEVLVGDWDANGTDTLAMRRNGNTYFISNSIANPDSGVDTFTFGKASDEVYAGKWK